MGYGVIRLEGKSIVPIDYGAVRPPTKAPTNRRFHIIFEALEQLIEKFRPDAISVETQFIGKNPQSALRIGMARALVVLAAERSKIPLFEYAPSTAKLAVVGSGKASKEQVQRMIMLLLSLPSLPTPEDASDALALALCHAHRRNPHV